MRPHAKAALATITSVALLSGCGREDPPRQVEITPAFDNSTIFDVPEGDTYTGRLTPDQAQEALAEGISCDIQAVKHSDNLPLPNRAPHTILELDVSLHFTPQAAAAYRQYQHSDDLLWRGGSAAEVYGRKASDGSPAIQAYSLGATIMSRNSSIEIPDKVIIVPTEVITNKYPIVPHRILELSTETSTVVSVVPCGQLIQFENVDDQLAPKAVITDLAETLEPIDFPVQDTIYSEDQTYSGRFYPTS